MTLSGLAFISGLFWVDVVSKQVLVCPVYQLEVCIALIPSDVRLQLPTDPNHLMNTMAQRHAMVIPFNDPDLSGMVLIASEYSPQSQALYLDNEKFEFALSDQAELGLWHEIGHLEAQALADDIFGRALTPFEHEWIADCYVVWRVAHEKQDLTLAWQQYHRRNLDVISNKDSISHWTVPVLWSVLKDFDHTSLRSFKVFSDFLRVYHSTAALPSKTDLFELSNLLQRTFGMGMVQSLPHYLFWRKADLTTYLRPTLEQVMGQQRAGAWIIASSLWPLKNQ
ncbi:hypothetical protein [Shewanella surugensis]|uniref:Peptidase M60 domain-containing protein n=1 Tax=Shewanella surugensis TaxID=212020 RepID=A0ABT0LDY7_9GAMM|nr:hypothetical protein [Shewanella surugensis]MCL1125917.1 hypothetical protein [Shewanella surugensis]